ncbi:MAG: type I glutamate--ammonia ligase [Lachnospiraceae bacterium]|nr:type I glutamate--ammonia ligase [Lachnospiraceae bacterium]MDE7178227.1 type I glutamate--ammonia ligase [Lachnospiraceae bacterium]
MRDKSEILQLVKEEDVEFIRLQFTDLFGTLKNVAVTAGQLERAMDNQYKFDGSLLYGDPCRGEEDMYLHPDLDTFAILPWRPQQGKVARLLCDVCKGDGTPFDADSRSILKRVLEAAGEKGYQFMVDPECEFFLFHTDENGIPTTVTHEKAGYMDISPLDLGENARRDMVLTLEEMGFEIESSHHETAPAQHEIDFNCAEALKTADSIVTFKTVVRSIAKRHGLHATFMPKPRPGVAGSGMHLTIQLYKDSQNVVTDSKHKGEVSDEARWFIEGIMNHAKAMCAVTNPLVNSYKRLNSGFEAPRDIIWTTKNLNALIRVAYDRGEAVGIELRFPDPSANPYLTLAVCLAAGMDGIEKRIFPGVMAENCSGNEIDHLPETLWEAVDYMEKDDFMNNTLGRDFVNTYIASKRAEWNEYMSQVSEWEIEKYLYRT